MATLAAVATIAVGAISYQTTSSRLLRAVDDSLVDATAVATARRFDERLFDSGPFDGVVVQAILKDGSVLRSNFPKQMKPNREDLKLIGRAGVTNFRSTQLGQVEYRIRSIGFEDGIIQIGRPLAEMNAVLESLRLRTLLLVTGVTLAAGALGAVVAGRVTRPLRVLTNAASEIESTGRLELADGDRLEGRDEVGRLFNCIPSHDRCPCSLSSRPAPSCGGRRSRIANSGDLDSNGARYVKPVPGLAG